VFDKEERINETTDGYRNHTVTVTSLKCKPMLHFTYAIRLCAISQSSPSVPKLTLHSLHVKLFEPWVDTINFLKLSSKGSMFDAGAVGNGRVPWFNGAHTTALFTRSRSISIWICCCFYYQYCWRCSFFLTYLNFAMTGEHCWVRSDDENDCAKNKASRPNPRRNYFLN